MFDKFEINIKKLKNFIQYKIINIFAENISERMLLKSEFRCSKETQILLMNNYKLLIKNKIIPKLSDVGFRCYSQFEEDGILLYIFSCIGTTNKIVVEISAGDGRECMSTNLILNHGWWGYLFDGKEDNVEKGMKFFLGSKDTFLCPPKFTNAWITKDNVNDVLKKSGVEGEIDLLSIDIDGMDYWIWDAIECIKPRVLVIETQNIISHDRSLTVPYDPNFDNKSSDFFGASLLAMTKLSKKKGYRLIGTHRFGFNTFFIRKDLARDLLPAVTPKDCLKDGYSKSARAERWPKVKNKKWVIV